MNQKLPAIIGIAGFVTFLGAEGDAYCNIGSYIIERAVIGVIMVVCGWAWEKIRAAHAGSTARTARKEDIDGERNPWDYAKMRQEKVRFKRHRSVRSPAWH